MIFHSVRVIFHSVIVIFHSVGVIRTDDYGSISRVFFHFLKEWMRTQSGRSIFFEGTTWSFTTEKDGEQLYCRTAPGNWLCRDIVKVFEGMKHLYEILIILRWHLALLESEQFKFICQTGAHSTVRYRPLRIHLSNWSSVFGCTEVMHRFHIRWMA